MKKNLTLNRTTENIIAVMEAYTPDRQLQFTRDEMRCYFGNAPTIAELASVKREFAKSWLKGQIYNLSEFAGCKDKLTLEQYEELADIMSENFAGYKLTEFMLFFQKFKRCMYGKFYGVIDPLVIMQALRIFSEERDMIVERNERERNRIQRFVPPKGFTSLSWIKHVRNLARNGNEKAISLLNPKDPIFCT